MAVFRVLVLVVEGPGFLIYFFIDDNIIFGDAITS